MDYLDDVESNLLIIIPALMMVIGIIIAGKSGMKVVGEHFADNSRTGRTFLMDFAYALLGPAALFAVGGLIMKLPDIAAAFGL